MKKVMIGILILIPVIILLIVAAVSNIVTVKAWIAVEDMDINFKGEEREAEVVTLEFEQVNEKIVNFKDFVDVVIHPSKANMYSISWSISDLSCTDSEYKSAYDRYLLNKDLNEDDDPDNDIDVIAPPAYISDGRGDPAQDNLTGDFKVNSYCRFTVHVEAEAVHKSFIVSVEGYNVKNVSLVDENGAASGTLKVGQSVRLEPNYTPFDSIVNSTKWYVDDPSVATVDANGVVTARSAGTAKVHMEASLFDGSGYKQSNVYTLTVAGGASAKFGDEIVTSERTLTFERMGISEVDSFEGCQVDTVAKTVTVTNDIATLTTEGGTLTIRVCAPNALAIENAASYSYEDEGDFVLEASELPFKLKAIWSDMLRAGVPENVTWTSSNEAIARIDSGGVLTPTRIESGIVEVTAQLDGQEAVLRLNVQKKLTIMNLSTSDAKLQVGLARQTVFASEKFVLSDSSQTEANSVNICVVGEPKNATAESLANFYSAYKFKVLEGEEFASFSAPEANKLVFDKDAIAQRAKEDGKAGKGVVQMRKIVVEVSARYNRYQTSAQYTTETVTINVVYGVEVNDVSEFRRASVIQEDLARESGNWQPSTKVWDNYGPDGRHYVVQNAPHSLYTYSVCFNSDFMLEPDAHVTPDAMNYIVVYGNVYGNGHMMSAKKGQIEERAYLFATGWSDVTVSNVQLRADELGDDTDITAGETRSLMGGMFAAWYGMGKSYDYTYYNKYRLNNLRVEFSIFENGLRATRMQNVDITYDGCVTRNISSAAYYIPATMNKDGDIYMPKFSHVTFNNCVYSNILSSIASVAYERFTVESTKNEDDSLKGYFYPDDIDKNSEYFMQNFASAGINLEITQTGFMDIYNWQNVENANLLDLGDIDEGLKSMIDSMSAGMIRHNKMFDDYRYTKLSEQGADECYLHLGFIVAGISFGQGIMNEPTFLKFTHEDDRFGEIYTRHMNDEGNVPDDDSPYYLADCIASPIVSEIELHLHLYTRAGAEASGIVPGVECELTPKMISHLHGEA